MVWFKVSDKFHSDESAIEAGLRAIGLWTMCGSWALDYNTEGHIPTHMVKCFGGTARDSGRLVDAGLWQVTPTGFQFPNWESHLIRSRGYISEATRDAVYARDGYECTSCRNPNNLSLDHIYPWSKGGSDHESNLQTLCRSCNSKKGARV